MRKLTTLILAAAMLSPLAVLAQNDSGTKQDMKNAGTDTKDAAKSTGRGVKQATKKSYHATKRTTKKVVKKVDGKSRHYTEVESPRSTSSDNASNTSAIQ